MGNDTKPRNFQGTRDFWGDQALFRERLTAIIAQSFQKFGFEPLETPIVETLDTLSGKEGTQKIFRLSSDHNAAMRFDQTVPLARFMAMNWEKFPLPYRRYVIGPVFRDEATQSGRLRQFIQADFDTVGSTSPVIDAEIVALNYTIFNQLGFGDNYTIRINDRRLLDALAWVLRLNSKMTKEIFRAWDKLEKASRESIAAELVEKGFPANKLPVFERLTDALESMTGSPSDVILSKLATLDTSNALKSAVQLLDQLLNYTAAMGVPQSRFELWPLMARGLDYYTGPIFETVVTTAGIGSITGGGRYDHLIRDLGGPDLPASGSSIGFDRLIDVMREMNLIPAVMPSAEIFVPIFDLDNMALTKQTFAVANILRLTGYRVEVYTGVAEKLGKQLDIARRKQIPFVVILGPDELQSQTVVIKDMNAPRGTTNQFTTPLGEMVDVLKTKLQA